MKFSTRKRTISVLTLSALILGGPAILAGNATLAEKAPVLAAAVDSQVPAASAWSTSNKYASQPYDSTGGRFVNKGRTSISFLCHNGATYTVMPEGASDAVCRDVVRINISGRSKLYISYNGWWRTTVTSSIYLSNDDRNLTVKKVTV